MVWDILVMRAVHILSAVIWVGNGFVLALWFGPASVKAGRAGMQYWEALVKRTPFVRGLEALTLLTVLSGLYLYWRLDYIARMQETTAGVVLTVGAAAGLVLAALTPVHARLTRRIWEERDAAGAHPSLEAEARIAAIGRRFMAIDIASVVLGLVAVVGMATARYW